MSATDELRRLLDERGVDYIENDFGITWSYYSDPHTATESMDGTLIVTGLTPAQAIVATLGESMTDAEKDALERRIDELCAEVEALKRDEWTAGFNAGCEAVEAAYEDGEAHYEAENAKLREQVDYMTPLALYAASERERDRMRELGVDA